MIGIGFSEFMRDFSYDRFQSGANTVFGAFRKAADFLPVHLYLGRKRDGDQLAGATLGWFIPLWIDRNQN